MGARRVIAACAALLAAGCSAPPSKAPPIVHGYVPHPSATWPWPNAEESTPHRGVTHWIDATPTDGTTLDLIRFDFKANPNLRLEIYDQDQDDSSPFDNSADYYGRGVGAIVKHLNESGRGMVVSAWNGLFFAYGTPGGGPGVIAHHIGPVVLGGKVHYNVGNHRWSFGTKLIAGKPTFRADFLPPLADLSKNYDFAASGAQALVKEGKPLALGDPNPSPDAAGTIPTVDDMRTSRVSMAWSKDNRYFYLLFVNEPDTELASKLEVRRNEERTGGWALADLQRFWLSFGAWGAINSDGGAEAQLAYLRPDQNYDLVPARVAAPNKRLIFTPEFKNAPAGGSLMTFYVRDSR